MISLADVKKTLDALGFTGVASSPEEFQATIKADNAFIPAAIPTSHSRSPTLPRRLGIRPSAW